MPEFPEVGKSFLSESSSRSSPKSGLDDLPHHSEAPISEVDGISYHFFQEKQVLVCHYLESLLQVQEFISELHGTSNKRFWRNTAVSEVVILDLEMETASN